MGEEERGLGKVVLYSYPILHHSDMEEGMAQDVMDICINACEKHTSNNQQVVRPPLPAGGEDHQGGAGRGLRVQLARGGGRGVRV